jgi:SET domain-containing protein
LPSNFEVLPTELKGNGLFSRAQIRRGTFLFDYEGERIDEAEYRRRYPDRVSDYAVGIKKNGIITFIDGADPAVSGLPRYMNHSAEYPNVKMQVDLVAEPPRVLMHAIRDIQPGDELVWNYGIGYVQAHPNLVEDVSKAARPAAQTFDRRPQPQRGPQPAMRTGAPPAA